MKQWFKCNNEVHFVLTVDWTGSANTTWSFVFSRNWESSISIVCSRALLSIIYALPCIFRYCIRFLGEQST